MRLFGGIAHVPCGTLPQRGICCVKTDGLSVLYFTTSALQVSELELDRTFCWSNTLKNCFHCLLSSIPNHTSTFLWDTDLF